MLTLGNVFLLHFGKLVFFLLKLSLKLCFLFLCLLVAYEHLAVIFIQLFNIIRLVDDIGYAFRLEEHLDVLLFAALVHELYTALHRFVLLFFLVLCLLILGLGNIDLALF